MPIIRAKARQDTPDVDHNQDVGKAFTQNINMRAAYTAKEWDRRGGREAWDLHMNQCLSPQRTHWGLRICCRLLRYRDL